MKVIRNISTMADLAGSFKKKSLRIGFIPTMGALHEGHLGLVRRAKKECDKVVVSIFVNPAQFGPREDFKKYPRTFKKDAALLKKLKVDVIFYPDARAMYPDGYRTYVNVEGISGILCGKSRPGHFRGVATVVAKLFNIVKPDTAYFGQKDAQQFVVIKRMAEDLNMDIIVKAMPIIREKDGLAMSSRNKHLTADERNEAAIIHKALTLGKALILENGIRDKGEIIKRLKEYIAVSSERARIEYIDIVRWDTLEDKRKIRGKILLAGAVWFGKTRLIDNIVVNVT